MFTSIINLGVMDGVPNANLFEFMFLLVNFGKDLCSSANELQQISNGFSREEYIPQKNGCFVIDSSCLHLNFVASCLLSVTCKQYAVANTI